MAVLSGRSKGSLQKPGALPPAGQWGPGQNIAPRCVSEGQKPRARPFCRGFVEPTHRESLPRATARLSPPRSCPASSQGSSAPFPVYSLPEDVTLGPDCRPDLSLPFLVSTRPGDWVASHCPGHTSQRPLTPGQLGVSLQRGQIPTSLHSSPSRADPL